MVAGNGDGFIYYPFSNQGLPANDKKGLLHEVRQARATYLLNKASSYIRKKCSCSAAIACTVEGWMLLPLWSSYYWLASKAMPLLNHIVVCAILAARAGLRCKDRSKDPYL
jgi:hypothetical protein